jgi:hypothetical protein
MTIASLVRLAGFLIPALIAMVILERSRSWWLFVLAMIAVLAVGALVERLYQRLATPEEKRRDLEDRVRNPPP